MAKNRLPSSSFFTLGLVVLGFLPAIQAPWQSLTLDSSLGTLLYVTAIIVLGVGYFFADRHEQAQRRLEREEQARTSQLERQELEAKSENRHLADLAATAELRAFYERESAKMLATQEKMLSLMRHGVSADNPRIQELAESVKVSAATIATAVGIRGLKGFHFGGIVKP